MIYDNLQTYKRNNPYREQMEKDSDEWRKQRTKEMLEKENIEDETIEEVQEPENFKDDSEEIMQKAEEIENRKEQHHYKSKKKKEYIEDDNENEFEEQEQEKESEYDTNSNYKQDKPEDLISPRSKKKLAMLTQSIIDLQNMVSVFKNRVYGFPLTVRNEVSRNLMKSAHKLQKLQNKYVKKYHKGKDFSEMPISDDHLLSYYATRLEELDV